MNTRKQIGASLAALSIAAGPTLAAASDPAFSTVAIGGYDPVSYFAAEKPVRGNGNHVVVLDGVTYLFSNDANKKAFEAEPSRYLPAYGGYCAYGVAIGKKFVGDPDVWEIVDGRLYLNLDDAIKSKWVEDVAGNVRKADANWPRIRDREPAEL